MRAAARLVRRVCIVAVGALVVAAAAAALAAGCGGSSSATPTGPTGSPSLSPGPGQRSTYADPSLGVAFQLAPGFVPRGPTPSPGSGVSGATFYRAADAGHPWSGIIMLGAADQPGASAVTAQGLAALLNQKLSQAGSSLTVEGPALATTVGPGWPAARAFYRMKLSQGFPSRIVGQRARVEEIAFVAGGRLFELSLLSVPPGGWATHRARLELPLKTLRAR